MLRARESQASEWKRCSFFYYKGFTEDNDHADRGVIGSLFCEWASERRSSSLDTSGFLSSRWASERRGLLYVRRKWLSQGWVWRRCNIWVKTRVVASGRIVGKGCMLVWYVVEVLVFLLWGGKYIKRAEVLVDLHNDGIGVGGVRRDLVVSDDSCYGLGFAGNWEYRNVRGFDG